MGVALPYNNMKWDFLLTRLVGEVSSFLEQVEELD